MYTLNFDGLFREHTELSEPGKETSVMCYGWLVTVDQRVIARGQGSYTHREVASSNGAEYLGLIEGLQSLFDLGLINEPVLIVGDSRSVIDQMQGLAEVSSHRIKTLHNRAIRLCHRMGGLHWRWVPRNENKAADQLTRAALRQVRRGPNGTLSTIGGNKRHGGSRLISDLMICQRPARAAMNP
jgi:ribonuclease HI